MENDGPSVSSKSLDDLAGLSPEGFMLFYMGRGGEPEYYSYFKNSVMNRAMVSYLDELTQKDIDYKQNEKFKEEKVIHRLFEHSSGGYLMIYFNDDDADYISTFDSKNVKRGMISFIKDILLNLRMVEQSEYVGHFMQHDDDEPFGED